MSNYSYPTKSKTENRTLEITALGGLGQFGMNMLIVRFENTNLMIDAGSMFPDSEDFGIERIIPDLEYLRGNHAKIDGLILTHAHEDHIGAVPYLWDMVDGYVYGTAFTLALLEEKLIDHGLNSESKFSTVESGNIVTVGEMQIEFITVAHSIPGSLAIAVYSPLGTILHTGDFKIEKSLPSGPQMDLTDFEAIGRNNVLALLSDSTNITAGQDSLTEVDVMKTLKALFQKTKRLVVVAIFSSSIHRIQTLTNLAFITNRKIALLGKRLERNAGIAKRLGLLAIPKDLQIGEEELHEYSPEQVLCVTTGSQGERFSAMSRIARGEHKYVSISNGDTVVFSSRTIPGNEVQISRLMDQIAQRGAEIIDITVADVHASGHATASDLETMINAVNPQYFIPIHGNYRNLHKHAQLAKNELAKSVSILLLQNGDRARFDQGRKVYRDSVTAGLTFVDKTQQIVQDSATLRTRRDLAKNGIVIISTTIDRSAKPQVQRTSIETLGLIGNDNSSNLIKQIPTLIENIYRDKRIECDCDYEFFKEQIKLEVRKLFKKFLGSRPLIMPIVMEV